MNEQDDVLFDYREEVDLGYCISEVGTYTFDASDILGALSTEDLPEPDDLDEVGDFIIAYAIDAGIIPSVEMYTAIGGPQYEEYLEARKSGEIVPDRSACARRLLEKTVEHESELIKEMQGKIADLEELVADIDRNDGKSLDELMDSKDIEAELNDVAIDQSVDGLVKRFTEIAETLHGSKSPNDDDNNSNDGNIGSSVGEHLPAPVSKEDKGDEGGSHFSLDDLLLDAQAAYEYQNYQDDTLPVIQDDGLDR